MTFDMPLYKDVIRPAAARVAPLVKKYGWDRDDCEQYAAEWMLVNGGPKTTDSAYVSTCLRRALLRAARPSDARSNAERTHFTRLLEYTYASGGAAVDVEDLITSAPPAVRAWMQARVVDGATWDEACEGLGWTRAYAAQVRSAAAEWLMQQFEGEPK